MLGIALVHAPAGPVQQQAGGFQAKLHFGDTVRYRLVGADRLAELATRTGVGKRLFELALHHAQECREQAGALPAHRTLEHEAALPFFTQAVGNRDPAAGESHFAGRTAAQADLAQRLADHNARALALHHEPGDAQRTVFRLGGGVGDEYISYRCVAGEALETVKDITTVVLRQCAGLQCGRVGTRAWLGDGVGADQFATGHLRQQVAPQRFAGEFDDGHRAGELVGCRCKHQAHVRTGVSEGVHRDRRRQRAKPLPAIVAGNGEAEQAGLPADSPLLGREMRGRALRQAFAAGLGDLSCQLFLGIVKVEVHVNSPCAWMGF